jgi:hypothetical protein
MYTTKRQLSNQMKGLHNWTEEEFIVCYYITKFKFLNIKFRNIEDVCKVIGVPIDSFKMMMCNFRHLMGFTNHVLTHIKTLQRQVHELLRDESQYEVYRLVKDIIRQDDYEREKLLSWKGYSKNKMVCLCD